MCRFSHNVFFCVIGAFGIQAFSNVSRSTEGSGGRKFSINDVAVLSSWEGMANFERKLGLIGLL